MRFTTLLVILITSGVYGQSYRQYIEDLCAPELHGRGYYRSGDSLAAVYVKTQFEKIGLEKVSRSYLQPFSFSVNTFPEEITISIDGKKLQTGRDFIPDPSCRSICGSYDLFYFDKEILHNKKKLQKLDKKDFSKTIIVVDKRGFDEKLNKSTKSIKELLDMVRAGAFNNPGTIIIEDKLTFGVSGIQSAPVFDFMASAITAKSKTITINLKSKVEEYHQSYNVIGAVKGTQYPDSFLVVSAHFDHLGSLGGTATFRGANDNASGVALMLTLAEKVKEAPLPCSVLFIGFAAEEAGLLGSDHFIEHPVIPLKKIGFEMNFDIVGTGNEGIMVVNGAVLERPFKKLNEVNDSLTKISPVKPRGKAAISDHFRFTEAGVPAFYIYTLGGSKAYHDIDDIPSNLTFDVFEKLASLVYAFYSGPIN
jgi:aminopeptidase YwaD